MSLVRRHLLGQVHTAAATCGHNHANGRMSLLVKLRCHWLQLPQHVSPAYRGCQIGQESIPGHWAWRDAAACWAIRLLSQLSGKDTGPILKLDTCLCVRCLRNRIIQRKVVCYHVRLDRRECLDNPLRLRLNPICGGFFHMGKFPA